MLLVEPRYLAPVAGVGPVYRDPLDHVAVVAVVSLVAQPPVGMLLQFLGGDVFVGELAAHERAGLVLGGDAPNPVQSRQKEPLVVVRLLVRVRQQDRPLHVGRRVEDAQTSRAFAGDFERADANLPLAGQALPVAKHHAEVRDAVTVSVAETVRLFRDGQPPLLRGGFFAGGIRRPCDHHRDVQRDPNIDFVLHRQLTC